eukprot:TRINITY_DN2004_c0_g1_i4.p1 TRINITY_DN2004_c0_g1~~TRINITY_DN2004_c0_g1_i4.p1  ORF type:complete len:181 (-),score=21.57 TRINITY_DN2004_c0_g1_i4:66-608(-)
MVSNNASDLMLVAQRARETTYTLSSSPALSGTTSWTNCVSQSRPTNVDAVRCKLTLSRDLDVSALALACSRPNCTIQVVATTPTVTIEYRPNYPASFTSEPVGASINVNDDAFLTDGFSTLTFLANMTFTEAPTTLLETSGQVVQQADVNMGDCMRYRSLESFSSIRTFFVKEIIDDIFD